DSSFPGKILSLAQPTAIRPTEGNLTLKRLTCRKFTVDILKHRNLNTRIEHASRGTKNNPRTRPESTPKPAIYVSNIANVTKVKLKRRFDSRNLPTHRTVAIGRDGIPIRMLHR